MLRPWLLTDAAAVMEAFGDPDIQRWHVRRADSVDEASQWIRAWQAGWADESQLNWALVDRASDLLLGRMSLKAVDLHDGSGGLAYWVVPASRGRGLCPAAAIALCQWAFNEAGFHRVELEHSIANLNFSRDLFGWDVVRAGRRVGLIVPDGYGRSAGVARGRAFHGRWGPRVGWRVSCCSGEGGPKSLPSFGYRGGPAPGGVDA